MDNIESFFDSKAEVWDKMESHTDQERRALLDKVGINKNDKVIDIACGTGIITKLIHEYSFNDVLAIDISHNMINIAKEKYKDCKWANFEHIDLYELKDEEAFDKAIIYNAYPHFLNPLDLAIKLNFILKSKGKFAILHSLSRKELDLHHSKIMNISRSLSEPKEEFKYFEKYFNLSFAYEDDHSFILIGEKK